ncbi:MAG: flagellar export protein FliJ [Gammaproteobacteria bacterium]|nr:flagellar export protein FliJ [Gammaproteobacteria bacterium]
MAKKSTRFKSVVRYTESKEDKAKQDLAASQRDLLNHQQQLQSLIQYREEYAQQFIATGQRGMSAASLQDYHGFLNKLKQAIDQQQRLVEVAEDTLEVKKKAWLKTRTDSQKVNLLLDKYILDEQSRLDKAEQKESDERSQRNGGHGLTG